MREEKELSIIPALAWGWGGGGGGGGLAVQITISHCIKLTKFNSAHNNYVEMIFLHFVGKN